MRLLSSNEPWDFHKHHNQPHQSHARQEQLMEWRSQSAIRFTSAMKTALLFCCFCSTQLRGLEQNVFRIPFQHVQHVLQSFIPSLLSNTFHHLFDHETHLIGSSCTSCGLASLESTLQSGSWKFDFHDCLVLLGVNLLKG